MQMPLLKTGMKFLAAYIPILVIAIYISRGQVDVIELFGAWAPMLTTSVHVLMNLLPVFSDLVPYSVVNGVLYSFKTAFVLSWLAFFISCILQYKIGEKLDLNRLKTSVDWSSKVPKRLAKLDLSHPLFIVVSKSLPLHGFANYLSGSTSISFYRYTLYSGIGYVLPSLYATAIGAGIFYTVQPNSF